MYDYALKNGLVVDGTRGVPQQATLYIKDGRIAAIDKDDALPAKESMDVTGKVVAPGFIDIHTHSDLESFGDEKKESKIFQGITLEVTGNCGYSLFPANEKNRDEVSRNFGVKGEFEKIGLYESYKAYLDEHGYPTHVKCLVGHGTLRGYVMGFANRPPTPGEMRAMCELLDAELKAGCVGLSLGLIYPPGSFCETAEILELAKVVKANNKIVAVHMRSESDGIFPAVDEMLSVARETGVHLHISHLKLMGTAQWGKASELLEKLENGRKEGLVITCDQYPYDATYTQLGAIIPKWAHEGGTAKLIERLKGEEAPKLFAEMEANIKGRGGAEGVVVSSTGGKMPELHGKTLAELAAAEGVSAAQAAIGVLVKTGGTVGCVYHCINPADIMEIIQDMRISVGSDGSAFSYDKSIRSDIPHPRYYGTFPKFIQTVRENNLMPVQDAVYKMTKLSADILGIHDRGVLQVGAAADITVLDWDNVVDRCTYTDSIIKPLGIEAVFVGGVLAVQGETFVNDKCGKVL